MERWPLIISAAVLCIILAGGCRSVNTLSKGQTPEEMAVMQESAIKGEDIPLAVVPEQKFVEPKEAGVIGIFKDTHFAYNKSTIRKQDYPILNEINKWAKENSGRDIMIEGHCDERGSNEYNMALGEQRALSIRRYLINMGIESSRLHTVSYGEEKPIDPGHTKSAWAKNRRGHFLITK